MDNKRHDFKGIKATGIADPEGDKAFDTEEFREPVPPGLSVIGVHSG
jgi:tRNA 2-thiocytidine biosynthesis protein TtcA